MKDEAIKIKDNLYYDERSAGGIVFKEENGKIYWLIIKTISGFKPKKKRNKKPVYKFPKGHLKKGEFLKQAALREVEEEGQIKAKILSKIGSNNYILWDEEKRKKIIKKVTFFLMEYTGPSSLKYFDSEMVVERDWFSFEDANEKLEYDNEKVLLKKAKTKLDGLMRNR
ncbi:MAG TPA: NUDIX domain-containing protein [Candidatus Paceibacterota bacterium]|jgi:ADP-ribose pyrophosphatase YjhB (NUDIX family)|nr:NUDIX domain-containing protein [Candidatus Paceibacterota bacterium]HOG37713.1 NUDIX domain-containing protein [Candidatus Woesebacteria bacterium]